MISYCRARHMTLRVCMTGEDLLASGLQNNIIAQQDLHLSKREKAMLTALEKTITAF